MKKILFSLVVALFLLVGSTSLFNQTAQAAVAYGNGVYTNLCGTGTAATANTCNRGCNTSTGVCSTNTNGVVKYTCNGRQTECRQNESSFSTSQQLAGTACGKTVQIDVFSKNCRVNGSWTCSESDLRDYMVWYSGDCQQPPSGQSCAEYQPLNTEFRKAGTASWTSGTQMSGLKTGALIDVNCFAKNGTALLPGAQIQITQPDGSSGVVNSGELRNFRLDAAGTYQFRCDSQTIANCSDADQVAVQSIKPAPSPVPPPASPAPSPTPDAHNSSCDDLSVVGGNDSLVPAKVTLRTRASDSTGNIQRYKYYFGDGEQFETDQPEVQHTYDVSGTFIARVDIKDSQGNWKTSNACEAQVRVKPSSIESHKSECSDVFISANNGAMAPSTITFDINGYDNKGDIQAYKIETGTDRTLEESDDKIEFLYQTPGTYKVRAYIKDSEGNWKGGAEGCQRTLYINSQPLTSQPATGTPTWFTVGGLLTGGAGLTLQLTKKKLSSLLQ